MICKNCATEIIIAGAKFCYNCGARLIPEEEDFSVQLTPKEEPDGVAYYDPYVEEIKKKGKNPTCGRIGLGLYLGAAVLQLIIGLKSGVNWMSTLAVSIALTPIIAILLIGALTLAIVSIVRKERGSSAGITLALIIVGVIYYIINVVATL